MKHELADGETDCKERYQEEEEVKRRAGGPLTDEEVPLGVQVGLVGQAAPHHVAAVALAGLEAGQPAAVGTVHHLGQGRAAAWNHVYLQGNKKKKRKVPPLTFHLVLRDFPH